jgi:hypothetical protein
VISARILVPALAGALAGSLTLLAPAVSAAPGEPQQAAAPAKPAKPAKKYKSQYLAAPSYPGSTMTLKVKGNPRAGSRVTLQVSGFNDHTDDSYYLDVYVAPRTVVKSCPRSASNMSSLFIENSDVIGDIGTYNVDQTYRHTVIYRSGKAKRVIYCAYAKRIVDDVVVGGLKHDFATPKPKPKPRGR